MLSCFEKNKQNNCFEANVTSLMDLGEYAREKAVGAVVEKARIGARFQCTRSAVCTLFLRSKRQPNKQQMMSMLQLLNVNEHLPPLVICN